MKNFVQYTSPDGHIAEHDISEVTIAMKDHNDPMSETGKSAARAAVLETQMILAQIDADIYRVECRLRDLKRQRIDAVDKIHQYQLPLARHRDVPSEILSVIFLGCYEGDALRISDSEYSSHPWNVSRVCKKWRAISLSTPSLWRHISVGSRDPLGVVKRIMSKAGNTRIQMESRGKFSPALCEFIVANLSCFRALDIEVTSMRHLKPLISLPAGNVEGLEALGIYLSLRYEKPYPEDMIRTLPFIENASSLRCLAVPTAIMPSSFRRLPLATITTLDLLHSCLSSDEIFILLSRCLSIVNCKVGLDDPVVLPLGSRSLALPYLRHFTLNIIINERIHDTSFPAFLAELDMPRLTMFELCNPEIDSKWTWPMEFTLAIAHSGCLEHLKTHGEALSAVDFDILLPAALGLRVFEPSNVRLSTQALQGIACGELLPNLVDRKDMHSQWNADTMDTLDLVLDIIEKRKWHLNVLPNWRFFEDRDPVIYRMHNMYSAGMIKGDRRWETCWHW